MVCIRAKTWIFWAQAIVFGGFGLFCLILGPLFLTGILTPAHGGSGQPAGVALSIFACAFLAVFALAIFNILACRQPLIVCDHETARFGLVGASALNGVPMVPGFVRVGWLILSGQGFRKQVITVPHDAILGVDVQGLPMQKSLTIRFADGFAPDGRAALREIRYSDAAFVEPIDAVAEQLRAYLLQHA